MGVAARVALLGALVVVLFGCGGSAQEAFTKPRTVAQFGYVKTLEPKGDGYELTFDPAFLLSGETASRAAAEDGAVAPGEPVPNDYYRVDEGHRLLTYLVPADARVTVLRDGVEGSEVSVEELAELVRGETPIGKPLFEPITTGFWIEVENDTVSSLAQQYVP